MFSRYSLFSVIVGSIFAMACLDNPASSQILPRRSVRVVGNELVRVAPVEVTVTDVPAASVAKVPSKAFCAAVRMHAARELRKQGKGVLEARQIANKMTDEVIAATLPDAESASGQKVGAIGDGTIFQKILDFFASPQGKAILDMLIQLLIHALVPVGHEFEVASWHSSLTAWNA